MHDLKERIATTVKLSIIFFPNFDKPSGDQPISQSEELDISGEPMLSGEMQGSGIRRTNASQRGTCQ
jgi:hypothetical protein